MSQIVNSAGLLAAQIFIEEEEERIRNIVEEEENVEDNKVTKDCNFPSRICDLSQIQHINLSHA